MPNASSVFKLLLREISIQEPTFSDAIILYRRNTKSELQKKDEKAPVKNASPVSLLSFMLELAALLPCIQQ